ncbi:MAG: hypothetical protein KF794_11480 [Xanthobacteraceae bacterium]|nr:hypothetical protein [Xanthobacteraceae bacterium]QYK46741.1 MAG: hypothetical protein KF794_11480 [Xanthobacteraceae bacterium]
MADLALYAHTHVAHEGDFDLSGFPALRRWLARIEGNPGHVGIDHEHPHRTLGLPPAKSAFPA